jgi:hypothetical protein
VVSEGIPQTSSTNPGVCWVRQTSSIKWRLWATTTVVSLTSHGLPGICDPGVRDCYHVRLSRHGCLSDYCRRPRRMSGGLPQTSSSGHLKTSSTQACYRITFNTSPAVLVNTRIKLPHGRSSIMVSLDLHSRHFPCCDSITSAPSVITTLSHHPHRLRLEKPRRLSTSIPRSCASTFGSTGFATTGCQPLPIRRHVTQEIPIFIP